jgi:hypothetical protein
MEPEDSSRFFLTLVRMGLMFSDQLSKERQLDYWDVLHDEMTIEEWEAVARQVKKQHRFHKVPLPADLIAFVQEARRPKNMPYLGA